MQQILQTSANWHLCIGHFVSTQRIAVPPVTSWWQHQIQIQYLYCNTKKMNHIFLKIMRVKQNFTGHCNARIEQMLGARLITQIQKVIFHGQEPWWLRPLQTLHQQNSTRHSNTAATEHQACHFSKEFVLSLQISASWVETLKRAKVVIPQNFWTCHFASKTILRVWMSLAQLGAAEVPCFNWLCDLEFFPSLSIDDEQASVGDARLGKAIAATDVLHSDTLGLSKQVRLTKIVDKAH